MSDSVKNQLARPDELQKAEGASATTSKLEPEMFGEIDKRLELLLARANKLETTLNELYDKNDDDDKDLNLESSEDFDFDEDIDLEDFDLESEESADELDAMAMNIEKIDLDIQED